MHQEKSCISEIFTTDCGDDVNIFITDTPLKKLGDSSFLASSLTTADEQSRALRIIRSYGTISQRVLRNSKSVENLFRELQNSTSDTDDVPVSKPPPARLHRVNSISSKSSEPTFALYHHSGTVRVKKPKSDNSIMSLDLRPSLYHPPTMKIEEYGTTCIFSYPVVLDKDKKFSHETAQSIFKPPQLINASDVYDEKFYGNVHLNFIGVHNTKKEEHIVVSVMKKAENRKYECLKTTRKGSDVFYIKAKHLIQQNDKKKKLNELIEEHLNNLCQDYSFYNAQDANFPNDFRQVEKKHPQRQKTMKIAFLYSVGTETTLQHFFDHVTASPSYFDFLDLLGQRINLIGWKKYRGDIGVEVEQDSYYTEWQGIEIMFHICLWMNAEQHRRLIGNDVVFVIYHDSTQPFDPAPLDALGTVPQVFAVVQKCDTNSYRLGYFSRPNIKSYLPAIPENFKFNTAGLKDFLFTKVYNGYCQSLSCPPMNRLFEVPRASSLSDLAQKYPRESKTVRRIRDQGQKKRRELIITAIKDPLLLLVTVVRCLPPRDLSNPQVYVSVLKEELRTKSLKGKHREIELSETLCFNILAVDPAVHFVKVELRENHKISSVLVGKVEISLSKVCACQGKDMWIELDSEVSSNSVIGMVCLRFELKGPAAQLCPKCKLYLGSEDLILYKDTKYHSACFICTMCNKKLSGDEFNDTSGQFFCSKCLLKNGTVQILDKDKENLPVFISEKKIMSGTSQHIWEAYHDRLNVLCGFCGELMILGGQGFQCTECKYPCHKQCKSDVPNNCSGDPKTQVLHSRLAKVTNNATGRLRSSSKTLKPVNVTKSSSEPTSTVTTPINSPREIAAVLKKTVKQPFEHNNPKKVA